MKYRLISLSGIDGAGKSTQILSIKKYYKQKNLNIKYLWTRGGNTEGMELLKRIARKFSGNRLPASGHSKQRDEIFKKNWVQKLWLTCAIIDLLRIYAINIRFYLMLGKVVICDRYLWDTCIDFKIMFPKVDFQTWFIWKLLVLCSPIPKVQYLLMIPINLSESRCMQKFEPFPDTPERRENRYNLYDDIKRKKNWFIIDATESPEEVFFKIKSKLP